MLSSAGGALKAKWRLRGANAIRRFRGKRASADRIGRPPSPYYWNRRSTAWLACEASDNAVVESCCRVCKASRLAPSSLESAKVSPSAPLCSVLIIALVKSWRICTVERFDPNAWAWDRSLVRPTVKSALARLMSAVVAQLLDELFSARPVEEKSTALMVTDDEPLSFSVTVRLALFVTSSRLMPLKLESPASWSIWRRIASNWAARPDRTVTSVVCMAWLASACADCTSLVIEVMPLLAAWIVLMPLDIESSRLPRSLARLVSPWAVKELIGLAGG